MSESCDTLQGPCACGAWHNFGTNFPKKESNLPDEVTMDQILEAKKMLDEKEVPVVTNHTPASPYDHLKANKFQQWVLSEAELASALRCREAVDSEQSMPILGEPVRGALTTWFETAAHDPDQPLVEHVGNIHTTGVKADHGKPQVVRGALRYFPEALKAVAQLSQFGAEKYTWDGWRTVPDGEARYTEALMRHLLEEAKDPFDAEWREKGKAVLHAAAVAWNALARLELILGRMPK